MIDDVRHFDHVPTCLEKGPHEGLASDRAISTVEDAGVLCSLSGDVSERHGMSRSGATDLVVFRLCVWFSVRVHAESGTLNVVAS